MAQRQTKEARMLLLHRDRACHCFLEKVKNEDKRCVYRDFPDGWSFVPEVGQAKTRGEIFTPRFVVEGMIVDSGMLPAAAVYRGDYKKAKEAYVLARVSEPAVGTANYLSTILFHKLRYAASLASKKSKAKGLDLDYYHLLLLASVASVYAYDIDAGNLEATRRRFLSLGKGRLNRKQAASYWTDHLFSALNPNREEKIKVSYERLLPSVDKSLNEGQKHWYKFIRRGEGIIDSAYREATGAKMPTWLYNQCLEILNKNIKLFNGIKEGDTLNWKEDFFLPGYGNVHWTWWEFAPAEKSGWQPGISEKEVSLKKMILAGQLEEVEERIARQKEEHWRGDDQSWESDKERRKALALAREKKKLEEELKDLP